MTRARRLVLVLVSVSSLTLGTGWGSAAGQTDAACLLDEARMSLSPGLHWTQPGNGDWESPLVPVTCVGTVEGRQIESTPGELRFSGTYEDATCALASGEGTLTVTLLTTDGPMTLSGTIRWTAEGPLARAQGRIGSSPFKAVGHFRPDLEHPDEDCYNRPLRHVILRGFGILGA